MKKHIFRVLFTAWLIVSSAAVFAQDPPPPPPGGGHGQTTNQNPGGSAPIGNGVALLVALAAGYGAWKGWNARKQLTE